jgi:hypothetical protein
VNAPEIAEDVEMQRACLYAFWAAFAQPLEMPFARCKFDAAQLGFLADKTPSGCYIAGHEHAEGDLQALANALVEGRQLGRAFRPELVAALNLLDR